MTGARFVPSLKRAPERQVPFSPTFTNLLSITTPRPKMPCRIKREAAAEVYIPNLATMPEEILWEVSRCLTEVYNTWASGHSVRACLPSSSPSALDRRARRFPRELRESVRALLWCVRPLSDHFFMPTASAELDEHKILLAPCLSQTPLRRALFAPNHLMRRYGSTYALFHAIARPRLFRTELLQVSRAMKDI